MCCNKQMKISKKNHLVKSVQKKNSFLKFFLRNFHAQTISDLKIIVPTPHNTPIIMKARDKNFYDPRSFEHRNQENKISKKFV